MAAWSNGSVSPLIFALNQPFLLSLEAHIAVGRRTIGLGSDCTTPNEHILQFCWSQIRRSQDSEVFTLPHPLVNVLFRYRLLAAATSR
ncbi:hypothetical protein JCGZ_13942 [Jatropha curcas]|uniref:Uncharacterized protein n=1 Tax=Jatropha curcas TaxID=180498 RepID=A0A067JW25_JATCU|nr:hypothetical protein JCGZ_13942 [Jatropha curcas]